MDIEELNNIKPNFEVYKDSKRFVILYNEKLNKYGIYDKLRKSTRGNFNFVDVIELSTPKIILCKNEDGTYNVYGKGVQQHYKVDEYIVSDSHTIMLGNGGFYNIYDEDFKSLSVPIKYNKQTIDFIKEFYSLNSTKRIKYLNTHTISMEIATILYIFEKSNEAYALYMSAKTTNSAYGRMLNQYFEHLETNMKKYCQIISPNVNEEKFKNTLFKICKGLKEDFSYIY